MNSQKALAKLLRNAEFMILPCSGSTVNASTHSRGGVHSYPVSANVDFLSHDTYQRGTNKYKYEGTNSSDRRLTLLFPWMMSKDKNIRKYADIYLNQGFDVVTVKVPPYDLFRPTKGAQITVGHLVNFLQENHWSSPIFVHGMSVGVYCFGELLCQLKEDPTNNGEIHSRLTGQVFDSPVDVYGLPKAMGKVLAKHPRVQDSLEMSINWFLKANYETATKHYNHSATQIYTNAAKVPALFMYSKNDPVSPPEMNLNVVEKLRLAKEPVFTKCFEKSSHVSHFQQYGKEYVDEINALLDLVGLGDSKRCSDRASVSVSA